MRIAVVGTGIAGNAAAYCLSASHEVVVYEQADWPGGHSATVDVEHDGRAFSVDTGFIVYNERNYPNLVALFDHLGVPTEPSDMTFSVSSVGGRREWSSRSYDTVFAQRGNLLSPGFLWMLRDVLRFNRLALADMHSGALAGRSLGEYVAERRFSRRFLDEYLLPMAGAIWSTAPADMLAFPAETFVAFYDNHGLIHPGKAPLWRTVTGGSRVYVERMVDAYRGGLRLGCAVAEIAREADGVAVRDRDGHVDRFDQVVLAAHSDQALALLADAAPEEREVLGAIPYRMNTVYLHRDADLMPRQRKVWSAWNYLGWPHRAGGAPGEEIAVTYWMNALQNLDPAHPLFVSLSPPRPPREELTFGTYSYAHPQFDAVAVSAQKRLQALQGRRRTWFCGAWTGYGFHEDGLVSGLAVTEALGGKAPWRARKPAERLLPVPA